MMALVRLGGAKIKPWTLTRGWRNEVGKDAHEVARSRGRSTRVEEIVLGGVDPVNFTCTMKKNRIKLERTVKMISQCDDLGPALGSFTVLKMLAFRGNLNHPI
jgi:hypothetical protein